VSTPDGVPDGPLAGLRGGYLVRQSLTTSLGNRSTHANDEGMRQWLLDRGATPIAYNENEAAGNRGVSGKDLSQRKVALRLLRDVETGELDFLAAAMIDRLTRDEFGADGLTIGKRLAQARKLLATYERIYRLWEPQEFDVFHFEVMKSGWAVRGSKQHFFAGMFDRAAEEAFFKSIPRYGYTTKKTLIPIRGTRDGVRVHKDPTKDPEQAALFADLREWFGVCRDRGTIAARVSEKYGDLIARLYPIEGRTWGYWRTTQVSRLLEAPEYWGQWEFGKSVPEKVGPIWDFNDRGQKAAAGLYRHDRPDLAYWTREEAARWKARLDRNEPNRRRGARGHGGGEPQTRYRDYDHHLLGVLACHACGRTLIGCGRNGYTCPERETGACPEPQTVSEERAGLELRKLLPEALERAAAAITAQARRRAALTEAGEARVAELRQELEAVGEKLASTLALVGPAERQSTTARRAVAALQEREKDLEHAVAEATDELVEVRRLHDGMDGFGPSLLARFDHHLTAEQQGAVYRFLLRGVRLRGEGYGPARRHVLVGAPVHLLEAGEGDDVGGTLLGAPARGRLVAYLSSLADAAA
jgi:hypothetical protein